MSKLILVRHGESAGNRDRIFAASPNDLPLTDLGYRQAGTAARLIAARFHPRLVVSSEMLRASETARVIAGVLAVPLQLEPNLHEREIGALRGHSYDSLVNESGYDPQRPWIWKPRDGESYEDVQARVAPIVDRLAAADPAGETVVVSHGGVMTCLWAYVTGTWQGAYVPPNCGIVLVERTARGYGAPIIIDGEPAAHAGG
jgi:broad specificity phosphatase PhoE